MKFVSFGEVLHRRFNLQLDDYPPESKESTHSSQTRSSFGTLAGAELNVLVNLCRLGHESIFVTLLDPASDITRWAISVIEATGVKVVNAAETSNSTSQALLPLERIPVDHADELTNDQNIGWYEQNQDGSQNGSKHMVYHRNNSFFARNMNLLAKSSGFEAAIQGCDTMIASTITGCLQASNSFAAWLASLSVAAKHGKRIFLDVNARHALGGTDCAWDTARKAHEQGIRFHTVVVSAATALAQKSGVTPHPSASAASSSLAKVIAEEQQHLFAAAGALADEFECPVAVTCRSRHVLTKCEEVKSVQSPVSALVPELTRVTDFGCACYESDGGDMIVYKDGSMARIISLAQMDEKNAATWSANCRVLRRDWLFQCPDVQSGVIEKSFDNWIQIKGWSAVPETSVRCSILAKPQTPSSPASVISTMNSGVLHTPVDSVGGGDAWLAGFIAGGAAHGIGTEPLRMGDLMCTWAQSSPTDWPHTMASRRADEILSLAKEAACVNPVHCGMYDNMLCNVQQRFRSDCRVVAILRGLNPRRVVSRCLEIITDTDCKGIEVTFDSYMGIALFLTCRKLILKQKSKSNSPLLIGVGTIKQPLMEVPAASAAGASFALSPVHPDFLISCCRMSGIDPVPGMDTQEKVNRAVLCGAKSLKLFPASKAWTDAKLWREMHDKYYNKGCNLMAVGGVDASSAGHFIEMGAQCLGVGSSLAGPDLNEPYKLQDLKGTQSGEMTPDSQWWTVEGKNGALQTLEAVRHAVEHM